MLPLMLNMLKGIEKHLPIPLRLTLRVVFFYRQTMADMKKTSLFLKQQSSNSSGKKISEFGYRLYSQNDEDGILPFIFSKISNCKKSFVEFGIGDGRECNTANLSLNYGWKGLLMDCDRDCISLAQTYYKRKLKGNYLNVEIAKHKVNRDNINSILLSHNVSGEIGLLSIDIDGNDYYVWENIDVINPQVVVIEYNGVYGSELAIVSKYDPEFERYKKHPSGKYFGASLHALVKLAKRKGYILVYNNEINAFFVREDVAKSKIPESHIGDYFADYMIHRFLAFPMLKELEYEYV